MPANQTKAQVAKRYKDAGIMQPNGKMEGEELQRHLRQRSVKFASARGKEERSRSTSRRRAIESAS